MAIIDPNLIDPDAPPRVRGQFIVQKWRDKYVFRSWPKRGGPKNPILRNWQRKQFAIVGQMAANPEPISLATATLIVKGTQMIPRDFLTMCCYGRGYIIEGPDGEVWPVAYHGPPELAPEEEEVAITGQWACNVPLGTSSSAYAAKGAILEPTVAAKVQALAFPVEAVSGATYQAGIYRVDGSDVIQEIVALSPVLNAPATLYTTQVFQFNAEATLAIGTRYALLHLRTDGSGTTPSGVHAGQYDALGIPSRQVATYARIAKIAPAVSDTLNTGANPFAYLIKWA